MNRTRTLATILATAGLMAAPGLALAGNGHGTGKNPHGSTSASGATGSTGHNGNAYGVLCDKESKVHVAGKPGTPFSQCVVALAKEHGSHDSMNPAKACAALSHKHVKGQKGTPFSQCVVAAAHLRGEHGATGATGATGGTGATGATGATG